MSSGAAVDFKKKFGGLEELRRQSVGVGDVGVLRRDGRYVYYLVTKEKYHDKPSMSSLKAALVAMKGISPPTASGAWQCRRSDAALTGSPGTR